MFSRPQQGMSLIEVMIAIGIISIVSLTFATMISHQNREITAVHQQLAAADFQHLLQSTLADGSVCLNLLSAPTPITFDGTNATLTATNPPIINLPAASIPASIAPGAPPIATAGTPVSPISPGLSFRRDNPFQITDIRGSGNVFKANFQVSYDNTRMVRPLKSASVSVVLQTTNTGTTHTVTSCGKAGSSSSTGAIPGTAVGGCTKYYTPGAPVVIGTRHCWGEVLDQTTSVGCQTGRREVQVISAEDFLSPGETTNSGADLYTACFRPLEGKSSCHISTYFCIVE